MDKYSKIQNLIDGQRMKKKKIVEIFEKVFCSGETKVGGVSLKLEKIPKLEIEFGKEEKFINGSVASNIKLKIVDKSSVKFIALQHKEKILEEYSKIFPEDLLKVF